MSMEQKKFSTRNPSVLPVFLIHISIVVSYHSSHNGMFRYVMNVMYLLNYINHPNFSILSASNNSINVKVKFYLYKPERHTGHIQVQLHSFLTLVIEEGNLNTLLSN